MLNNVYTKRGTRRVPWEFRESQSGNQLCRPLYPWVRSLLPSDQVRATLLISRFRFASHLAYVPPSSHCAFLFVLISVNLKTIILAAAHFKTRRGSWYCKPAEMWAYESRHVFLTALGGNAPEHREILPIAHLIE